MDNLSDLKSLVCFLWNFPGKIVLKSQIMSSSGVWRLKYYEISKYYTDISHVNHPKLKVQIPQPAEIPRNTPWFRLRAGTARPVRRPSPYPVYPCIFLGLLRHCSVAAGTSPNQYQGGSLTSIVLPGNFRPSSW